MVYSNVSHASKYLERKEKRRTNHMQVCRNRVLCPPYDTKRFAQIDYVLVPPKWRDAIENIETTSKLAIESDHKMIIADFKIKLGRKKTEKIERPKGFYSPEEE